MKILLVFNFFRNISGENVYFSQLEKLLKDKGHQVVTYTKNNEDISDRFISHFNIAKRMFWNHQVEKELIELIKNFQPNLVHFNNINPLITPAGYHICKRFNLPIVQTIHNYRYLCPKGTLFRNNKICELCVNKKFSYPSIIYGCYHDSISASLIFSSSFLFHKIIKSFDCIDTFIFPAEFIRDYHIQHFNIPTRKTKIIPNFVDGITLKSAKKEKSDYFLFVGRLSEEKGIIQLLDVFATLPELKLVVIGDGLLRERVDKYRKYKNITIKNFLDRNEVFKYMQDALFTIIPSLWYEVLPMVLIESLASGTPVIVPLFGTFRSLISDGKTGFFYKQNKFNDLREKILYTYKNRCKLIKMRDYARNEYESQYTADKHYKSLLKIYQKLAKTSQS